MNRNFRVIDTGLRGGRANIAFDQAMIEARARGLTGDTIRFLRFTPTALVGRHQILRDEIDTDAAARLGVELGRRVTGGGAIYLDPRQLGWEILCHRSVFGPAAALDEVAERICTAAAAGLSRLGVPAAFRPRNDIEVGGRKISGTGGFFDGDLLFYQGTVLFDIDIESMLALLRVPAAKLARHGAATLRERLAGLDAFLGRRVEAAEVEAALLAGFAETLGWSFERGSPTPLEEEAAEGLFAAEIGTDDFVFGPDLIEARGRFRSALRERPGGRIRADVALDHRGIIRDVVLSGDFFLTPPRRIADLEAFLRGSAAATAPSRVGEFFATHPTTLLGLEPADFSAVIAAALASVPAEERTEGGAF